MYRHSIQMKKNTRQYNYTNIYLKDTKSRVQSFGFVLYSHIHIPMQHHNDTINKQTQEDFFNKICLSLYCKGSKRLLKVWVWEGAGDRTKTVIFWPPNLWPSTLCLSRSPGLLNRRPRGSLCWMMVFFTASYQHLLWNLNNQCGFPYHTSSPTVWNSNSTELYNSSTPTRSLKSHV